MPRKTFLSFLGVNNYEPVAYYPENERRAGLPPPVKYVQQAILRELAAHFSPGDAAYIFLTEEARQFNWEADGHRNFKTGEVISNPGLERELRDGGYAFAIQPVDIDGESEASAIWNTFQTVFDCLEEGDEVYLDITHSWRYLPMLGMTLLNYAKALKKITVAAIYYGALEQLGPLHEVKQLPAGERPVPILNLVSFSELQDWAVAADDFVQDGNPTRLHLLTRKSLMPILRDKQGKDEVANNLNALNKGIQELAPLIATNRGLDIWGFPYAALHDALSRLSAGQNYIKPLNAVIRQIGEKVAGFQPDGALQWLESVHWCIRHNLIQQGVTQLQEGLLAWLCLYFERQAIAPVGFFDLQQQTPRDLLSAALYFTISAPEESKWGRAAGRHKEITKRVMADPLIGALARDYAELGRMRNDINHGGYTNAMAAHKFYAGLKKHYRNIRQVLEEHPPPVLPAPAGLLNLSNHPSDSWPADQRKAARTAYGKVADLPFPHIDPAWDQNKLGALAQHYYEEVRARRPAAVHLMGEMTFTYALVQKLKAAGIPCLASTTERLVREENGQKIVQFCFVQFREYF